MDIDLFWNKDDKGGFCLIFPNKYALEKSEIEDVFSQFGPVLSITCAGDEKGHRFVRYSSQEDALRAIDGIKGHKKIKLIPHRSKQQAAERNDTGNKNQNGSIGSGRKSQNYMGGGSNSRNLNNREKSNSNHKSFGKRDSSKDSNSPIKQDSCDDTASVKSLSAFRRLTISQRFQQSRRPSQCDKNDNEVEKFSDTASMCSIPALEKRLIKNQKPANSMLKNGEQATLKINEEEIPDLVKGNFSKKPELKPIILDAHDVVVGNIHSNYGAAYLLHLFERFDPLAISQVNITPDGKIRYCHVYFKTLNDATNVEDIFDKTDLEGQKLMVRRASRLIQEAL